jgi:hypothetical protein
MATEEITVSGDNIESFLDTVIEFAAKGFVRVDTMELSMGVLTNYWRCTMAREVEAQEPEAPKEESGDKEEVVKATKGRPAKKE